MVWGDAENVKLGTLPTAILAALNEGVDNITLITLGTGASHDETGSLEAQVTKDFLVSRLNDLEKFPSIRDHPEWQKNKELMARLVDNAVVDLSSQNTNEEIGNAAMLFRQYKITKVIEVTGASHAPRCQLLQGVARAKGVIPNSQQWQLVADDTPYTNTTVGDTVVIEEPHRGDDHILNIPDELRPAKLFRQFYTIPKDQQESFLNELAKLLEKYHDS